MITPRWTATVAKRAQWWNQAGVGKNLDRVTHRGIENDLVGRSALLVRRTAEQDGDDAVAARAPRTSHLSQSMSTIASCRDVNCE